MANTYISPFDYQRSPSGLESASLIGNLLRVGTGFPLATVGGTTITVTPALTVALNQYDPVTIFDGPNSEIVTVAAVAALGASSFTIQAPGLQFNHAAGTPLCSNGVMGSLSDEIVDACAELEHIVNQSSLFQTAYTGEILSMPSMDASIDNQGMLLFRPKHIPITALTSIQINTIAGAGTTFDATQAFIDASQQYVRVPLLNGTGSVGQVLWPFQSLNPRQQQWLTIGYTAGFAASALPADIRDAACLLVSDILRRRYNPTGADTITENRKTLVDVIRGDFSGQSLFYKQAKRKLAKYTRKAI